MFFVKQWHLQEYVIFLLQFITKAPSRAFNINDTERGKNLLLISFLFFCMVISEVLHLLLLLFAYISFLPSAFVQRFGLTEHIA